MKEVKYRVEVNQYAGGYVATAIDTHGLSIIDSESNQPTPKAAIDSLTYWLCQTKAKDEQLIRIDKEG